MKPKPLQQAVKEFKEQNGNFDFTQKDLAIYILHRLDIIDKRLDDGSQKFVTKDTFFKFMFAISAIAGGAIGYCFKLIVDIIKNLGG